MNSKRLTNQTAGLNNKENHQRYIQLVVQIQIPSNSTRKILNQRVDPDQHKIVLYFCELEIR